MGITRDGGGLRFRSKLAFSCRAAILAVVGMLSGIRFMGGSRSGWRVFRAPGVVEVAVWPLWADVEEAAAATAAAAAAAAVRSGSLARRGLDWRWMTAGGSSMAWPWLPVRLAVDELWMLLVSRVRFDLRFSRNDSSAGEPLGDS